MHLVALLGTGGCGKSQLAHHVAADLLLRFPDGVWLIDLAQVREDRLVPSAVAAAFGRRGGASHAIEDSLVAYLGTREVLLVLDNDEYSPIG